ncbi:hypothetical protein CYY_008206 [Polysphondylium violaceum]|uniref:Uncharacterized protein n=1 Tax=Polysphondylium violaceum TaxID=133409 RepID=A0A8J4PVN4_9MYCE|nr:hypothetical protein CYY_008206 [Polysphondylium violaceum]
MNNYLYKLVFNNIYIANKIFKSIHQLQFYKNSLKYDDIVDVGWMIHYNHIGLIRDKVNRNLELFINLHLGLLTKLANHTQTADLFIKLFELNKDIIFEGQGFNDYRFFIERINNAKVIKYLFKRGFGAEFELRSLDQLDGMDIQVLGYLLENDWCRTNFTQILSTSSVKEYYQDHCTMKKETLEKIELVFKYTKFSIKDIEGIISTLLENTIHFILDTLKPQHVPNKEYDKSREEYKDFIVRKYPELGIWYSCIGKDEQVFINTWNQLSNKIRVTQDKIYFTQDLYQTLDTLDKDEQARDIGPDIFYILRKMRLKSLKLVHFLIDKGCNVSLIDPMQWLKMCQSTIKSSHIYISQQDWDLISNFAKDNHRFIILVLSRFDRDTEENFKYFFKFFKELINNDNEWSELVYDCFQMAVYDNNYFLYHSLGSLGYHFSDYGSQCHYSSTLPFIPALPDVVRLFDGFEEKKRRWSYCTTLGSMITGNNFVGFKYLFNHYKFSPTRLKKNVMESLANSHDLSFIDYLWTHRYQCFFDTSVDEMNTFFSNLFNLATINQNMALREYLIQHKCVNANINSIQEPYQLNALVYLFDHYYFDSIDPIIDILFENYKKFNSILFIEYIYMNQDKLKTKPCFQSLFDKIIDQTKLNDEDFSKLLATLVNRYGCKYGHHDQYLAEYNDGSFFNQLRKPLNK